MKRLADLLLSFLFPSGCHVCSGRLMRGERFVCTRCFTSLPRTHFHRHHSNAMTDRLGIDTPIERATALFYYSPDSRVAEIVQDFKYRDFPSLALEMGRRIAAELLPTGFFHDIDILIPVPVHTIKRLRRGYNQVERICTGISDLTSIPVGQNLRALRSHSTQTAKSPDQRRRNVKGVFITKRPEELENRHILLVDDICTTGATLSEAAACIHAAAPSARISVVTLGITEK